MECRDAWMGSCQDKGLSSIETGIQEYQDISNQLHIGLFPCFFRLTHSSRFVVQAENKVPLATSAGLGDSAFP